MGVCLCVPGFTVGPSPRPLNEEALFEVWFNGCWPVTKEHASLEKQSLLLFPPFHPLCYQLLTTQFNIIYTWANSLKICFQVLSQNSLSSFMKQLNLFLHQYSVQYDGGITLFCQPSGVQILPEVWRPPLARLVTSNSTRMYQAASK
jgi:hypothetical protein